MPPRLLAFTTIATIASLYLPQPLLPQIAAEFGVSSADAGLLTTAAFLPLAVLPLIYGFLIESVSARRVIVTALAVLCATSLLIPFAPSFLAISALRVLQGAAVPAILTALMTHVSRSAPPERIGGAMGFYIAATIVGGFLGRALSGFVGGQLGWRASFVLLAAALLVCLALQLRERTDVRLSLTRPRLFEVGRTLGERYYAALYTVIFCVFFTFTAVLNFLPFRLLELHAAISGAGIGLVYSGYLIGIVVALLAPRLARRLRDELGVIVAALLAYIISVALWQTESMVAVLLNMLLFCAAMFTVHSLVSGALNARVREHKGVVNGLYVAAYYGGGTLGSYLPGLVYRAHGWKAFIVVLFAVSLAALLVAAALWRARTR